MAWSVGSINRLVQRGCAQGMQPAPAFVNQDARVNYFRIEDLEETLGAPSATRCRRLQRLAAGRTRCARSLVAVSDGRRRSVLWRRSGQHRPGFVGTVYSRFPARQWRRPYRRSPLAARRRPIRHRAWPGRGCWPLARQADGPFFSRSFRAFAMLAAASISAEPREVPAMISGRLAASRASAMRLASSGLLRPGLQRKGAGVGA